MPKHSQTSQGLHLNPEVEPSYTSTMRVFGGVAWSTLLTLFVGTTLILAPQIPRLWLWSILPIWIGLSLIGISLQWSVARGACPKCGYLLTVPLMGKRCPQCRSYLKAVDRKIIKI